MPSRERLRNALAAMGHVCPPEALPGAPPVEPASSPPPEAAAPTPPSSLESPAQAGPLAEILRGHWIETALGPAFVKDTSFALDHIHGQYPLHAPLRASPECLTWLTGEATPPLPGSLGFFDIETTGLSGGTGTIAFLACLGTFAEDGFRLRQYFLADLQHEKAMLSILADDLSRLSGIVSYNGRAFDLPVIQSRMTLARLHSPCGKLVHIDLLHPVRRLYRERLVSCRLAEAEARLLQFRREDDVPGFLIPSLYFDYVRAGRIAPLQGVFRHNADDVLSMVGILALVTEVLSKSDPDPHDAISLARWWELENRPERAESYYRKAVDELGSRLDHREAWSRAARRYASIRKRAGERREVVDIWRRLWAGGDMDAGIEIAKYLEHEAKDIRAAEELTAALLTRAKERERPEIEHRLARLRRRIAAHSV